MLVTKIETHLSVYNDPKANLVPIPDSIASSKEPSQTDTDMVALTARLCPIHTAGRCFWGLRETAQILNNEENLSIEQLLYTHCTHLTCQKLIFGDSYVKERFRELGHLYTSVEEQLDFTWKPLLEFEIIFSQFDISSPGKKVEILDELKRVSSQLDGLPEQADTQIEFLILITKGKCKCAIAEAFEEDWHQLFNEGLDHLNQARDISRYKGNHFKAWVKLRLWRAYRSTDKVVESRKLNTLAGSTKELRRAFINLAAIGAHRVVIKGLRQYYSRKYDLEL